MNILDRERKSATKINTKPKLTIFFLPLQIEKKIK